MYCINHPKKESAGACIECGRLFCDDCFIFVGRKRYCAECASDILSNPAKNSNNLTITQQTTNQMSSDSVESEIDNKSLTIFTHYIISTIFALLTISLISEGTPLFLVTLIVFLIWLPPVDKLINETWGFNIPLWIKIVSIIITILLIGIILG